MTAPWMQRRSNARYSELNDGLPSLQPSFNTDGPQHPFHSAKSRFRGDQEDVFLGRHISSIGLPDGSVLPPTSLGSPTAKRRLHKMQILSTVCSLTSLALAIATVANESLSWRLGVQNHQLIVLGFLLGIMQLCLVSVAPGMFLLLEARFGPSTLQNYEGLLRNQVLGTGLSHVWRFVLAVMVLLPLGLSIAYKTFTGGESTKIVNAGAYMSNASYYGMFAPPGLQSLGAETGISLFANATIPYIVASSTKNAPEPPFAVRNPASGFNVLSLSKESTAMLDIPEPGYVSAIQDLLAGGESWNITAPVLATVAKFNHSKTEDLRKFNDSFQEVCEDADLSSGAVGHISAINGYAIDLIDRPSPGDQSLQYVSIGPDPGIDHYPTCQNLSYYVLPHDITRKQCQGTWSITRGGIQLVDGFCDDTVLPLEKQKVIVNDTKGLFPAEVYMPSLLEFIGPFATTRNASEWKHSYLATSMAAMLWSRITAFSGATNLGPLNTSFDVLHQAYGDMTYEDAGLTYLGDERIVYIRPTLRKSPWLYLVLAIQPLLSISILGLTLLLSSTPVDKDFGLVSILSGVDRTSLDILAGATLSGELRKSVKLVIQPKLEKGVARIEYHITPLSSGMSLDNGRLSSEIVYH